MKKFNNNWPNVAEKHTVQLFAEQLLELVDNYSWSSYKAKTTSTPLKASEIKYLSKQVISGEIPRPILQYALEEYIDSVENDPIVLAVCKEKNIKIDTLFVRLDSSPEKILLKVKLFEELISPIYLNHCRKVIAECCGSKKHINLRKYIKLFVPALINTGVSRQWIYECVNEKFYLSDVDQCNPDSVEDFLKDFSEGSGGQFRIFFRTNKIFAQHLKGRLPDIELFNPDETYPDPFRELSSKLSKTSGSNVFVLMPPQKGNDPHSAARDFNRWISLFSSILYLSDIGHRRGSPKSILCCREEDNSVKLVYLNDFFQPGRERPFSKSSSITISDSLYEYAFEVTKKSEQYFGIKLLSALNAAAIASKTYQSDSRLLAIWSAFEGLLPAPPENAKSRISHFEGLITPCVSIDYIPRMFNEFKNDCLILNKTGILKFIHDNYGEDDDLSSFIKIFYDGCEKKKEFCKLISESRLLLSRAMELQKIANNPKQLHSTYTTHIRRVRWQINRIYRERNSIVHKASNSRVSQNLSEHAYSYFRSVVITLESVYRKYGVIQIDVAFDLINNIFENQNEDLIKISSSDIKDDYPKKGKEYLNFLIKNCLKSS